MAVNIYLTLLTIIFIIILMVLFDVGVAHITRKKSQDKHIFVLRPYHKIANTECVLKLFPDN